jgi:branched-chain amino acid transport system ATP-binding protein
LRVASLSLWFGGLRVLRGVSLSAEAGAVTALIGPNGAGKTALLNCINGIYRPAEGSIQVGGTEVVGKSPRRIAHLGVARTFQHVELFPRLTVLENVLVGRDRNFRGGVVRWAVRLRGAASEEVREREVGLQLLEMFGLAPYAALLPEALPYEAQKLLGLARAVALEPQIILLDEPGSGLSRKEKAGLAQRIMELRRMGMAVVWIEHDVELVWECADLVHVLDAGICIASGPPDHVKADAAVTAAYFGHRGRGRPAGAPSAQRAGSARHAQEERQRGIDR